MMIYAYMLFTAIPNLLSVRLNRPGNIFPVFCFLILQEL